ncbi:MAG: vitamin B12 dependent-methionine synthase activation domain-containing protein [Bacteroidota bacterium]
MRIHHLDIDSEQVRVDPKEILSLLGNEDRALESHTEELIGTCLAACKEVMVPQASLVWEEALDTNSREHISIKGTSFKTGKIIKRLLAGSEAYAFLIMTAGPGPELRARQLLEKGEFLEGYITDMLASALVDSMADQVQEHIRRMAAEQGFLITNRYSPGYCSWDVSEQHKLFRLFPENCCNITLTDSSLMSPIKSISALIGIGTSVRYQNYTCEICSMKDCAYRNTRSSQSH